MRIRILDLVNPGSGMEKDGYGLLDKHPGSATQLVILLNIPGDKCCGQLQILHNRVAGIPLRFLEYRQSTNGLKIRNCYS
jgi:hypothetical protein